MTFLELAVVFNQFPRIVTELCRNPAPPIPHRLDGWIVLRHDSVSPNNSRGVAKAGTNSPKIPLIRRMWANLLAFASGLDENATIHLAFCVEVWLFWQGLIPDAIVAKAPDRG
jgi:hypothetical protein